MLTAKQEKYNIFVAGEKEHPVETRLEFDYRSLKVAPIQEQKSKLVGQVMTQACGFAIVHVMFTRSAGPFPPIIKGVDTGKAAIAAVAISDVLKDSKKFKLIQIPFDDDDEYAYLLSEFMSGSYAPRITTAGCSSCRIGMEPLFSHPPQVLHDRAGVCSGCVLGPQRFDRLVEARGRAPRHEWCQCDARRQRVRL